MNRTELDARSAGRLSFVDGYTSTGGQPFDVYMDPKQREEWMAGWAEAEANPKMVEQREANIRRNIECFGEEH